MTDMEGKTLEREFAEMVFSKTHMHPLESYSAERKEAIIREIVDRVGLFLYMVREVEPDLEAEAWGRKPLPIF